MIVSDAADAKGGASLVAIQSALILARHGLNVRLFAATGPFRPTSEVPRNLTVKTLADGLDLIRAPALTRATQSLWNTDAAAQFDEFVSDLSPATTLVHVHSFQVQLTSSVIRRAVRRGFPLIVTSHDYGLACPYSGFYNYNTGAPCGHRALSAGCATTLCSQSKNLPGKLWHVAKAVIQRDIGRVANSADHLAFVSEFSRDVLRPYLPDSVPVSVIPNPIDLPQGPPRRLLPDAPFLFVGRLTKEKGPALFAEAARSLGVRAWIAGTGPEEDLIRQLNPDAELLGWKSPVEVRELMRQARALVFPSRWFEGQPLTVQEAQSVGLPVIASDSGAARALVEDGETGRIFRSGDAADLAEKMRSLTNDQEAIRMGRAAYDHFWCDPPTEEAHLAATLAMYREVERARGKA